MNRTNINTELPGNQQEVTLPIVARGAQQLAAIQTPAHEIEARIGNIAVLVESMFDKLDTMKCHTPADRQLSLAMAEYANAVMASAQAIRNANAQVLSLAGGVQ